MLRTIRTAAVFAALALAGCSEVSGPLDPSAAPRRNTAPVNNTTTTANPPDSTTARGIFTIGGG
jgi:PBP1b-binding outer membrane lipoprotein LpoB